MTDNDIFEKYKLVPHYVIKRTSLNNYRKKIKEYLSVSFEENNTLDCVTFKCKDDKSTIFVMTFKQSDIYNHPVLLDLICKSLTEQSCIFNEALVKYEYVTGSAFGIVVKDDNALSHFEHFIYKWTVHNGKNTMIISKLVNKKLVPLKKKIVDNGTPDDCGDYNLAIKGLELNGYKLIYSIKEVKERES